MEHQEKAESGPTKAQGHIDDDVGDGLSGLSVTEGGECIHRECGECGQRAEKAFANEVMPRDKGNDIYKRKSAALSPENGLTWLCWMSI